MLTPLELLSSFHIDILYALQKHPRGVNLDELLCVFNQTAREFHNPNTLRFIKAYNQLPHIKSGKKLQHALEQLKPWRKGPFQLLDIRLDAEWRSDLKWNRLKKFLPALTGKKILDIGCNNGYYLFRLAAHDPQFVFGIDPSHLCFFQFAVLQHYIQAKSVHYSLMSVDQIDIFDHYFDCILCLGVLYHRRSPIDVLTKIKNALQPGGTLILETLSYPGKTPVAFFPKDRYAKMRNVFFVPTESSLYHWLYRAGFTHIQTISNKKTTASEQRQTQWMEYESLTDFLDPKNLNKTIEGYTAPRRLMVCAQ